MQKSFKPSAAIDCIYGEQDQVAVILVRSYHWTHKNVSLSTSSVDS